MRGLRVLAAGLALAVLAGTALAGDGSMAGRRTRGMGLARGYPGTSVYLPYWSGRDLWCLEQRFLERRTRGQGARQQDPARAKRLTEEWGRTQGGPRQ